MWDVPVITDRTILANQPRIVLHNKEVNTHTDQYSHTMIQTLTQKKLKN
jgi:hypothetical protein